jgi:hypothetical protein
MPVLNVNHVEISAPRSSLRPVLELAIFCPDPDSVPLHRNPSLSQSRYCIAVNFPSTNYLFCCENQSDALGTSLWTLVSAVWKIKRKIGFIVSLRLGMHRDFFRCSGTLLY